MSGSFHTDARPAASRSAMGPHVAPPPFGADAALRAAHRVAALLRAGADPAPFASSGLGALNVPASHDGPGLSYEIVGHALRIVAEADRAAGEAIRHHLSFVAAIGCLARHAQQADLFSFALRGLRFGRPVSGPGHSALRLVQHPDGLRIEGALDPAPHREVLAPHLLPVRVRDERGRLWHAIVDADAVEARRRDPAAPIATSRQRLLPLDAEIGRDADLPVEPIRLLLRAAVEAGLAGRAVADRIGQLRDAAIATGHVAGANAVEGIGGLRLKLDAAIAMLEKAGRTVDRAVIRPTASSVALAQVSASGARILAAELAQQAGITRHRVLSHRSRRIGRLDPVRSRYALLGAFYLNAAAPASAP